MNNLAHIRTQLNTYLGLMLVLVVSGHAWGAISLVGTATGSGGSGAAGSLTITLPAGTAQDDVLLAQVAVGGNITITAPSGWTLISRTNNGTALTQAVYWRLAGTSNPASATWTFSASGRTVGTMAAYRGVDPISLINVYSARNNASATSVTAGSVTPTVTGVRLVGLFSVAHGNATYTPPASMDERADNNTGAGPNGVAVELADEDYAGGTAATGTLVATSSNAGDSVAHLIALAPAAAVNLLAEYRFDECAYTGTAGEVADTTGSYPATPRNGLNTDVGGQVQRMGKFDTYARWAEATVPIGNTWTYSFWLQTPITTTHRYHIAASVSGGGDMLYLDRNASFRWGVYTPGKQVDGSFQFGTLSAGWHHVLIRGSAATTQLFIDGIYTDSVANKASGTLRYIGTSYNSVNTSGAQGIGTPLDEVRVYTGQLSGTALLDLYNNQRNGLNADGSTRAAVTCGGGVTPGGFNAYEASTAAGSLTGPIKTKIAGNAFSLDLVALNLAGTALDTSFTGDVTVDLIANASTGVALGAGNCPVSGTTLSVGTRTIASGRSSVSFPAVSNAWRDVRVRVRYPTTSPTLTVCSTDNFAIRPNALGVAATDDDWATAGTTRSLNNTGVTGGTTHKAGQPFTLTATGYNSASVITTNYAGQPGATITAHVLPTSCAGCSLVPGTFSGSGGTVVSNTASYDEVGVFTLQLVDSSFASVDAADSSTAERHITSGGLNVGRFVPDHFDVAYNTPSFETACGSFGYLGQPFDYASAPVLTATAKNAAGTTTANYTGSLFKLTPTTLTGQAYTSASGTVEAVAGSLPAPSVNDDGTGVASITFGVGDASAGGGLRFARGTTPLAPFDADLALSINVIDSDGVTHASNPARFGQATVGNGIAFDAGKAQRFGRLKLGNVHGSALRPLSMPMETQYWNGSVFVRNSDDNCTRLDPNRVTLSGWSGSLAACETAVSSGGLLVNGAGRLGFSAPGAGNRGSVVATANLGTSASGNTCLTAGGSPTPALGADLPWLQGKWSSAGSWDANPAARASFGIGLAPIIELREVY
jgi:hypothetical protein